MKPYSPFAALLLVLLLTASTGLIAQYVPSMVLNADRPLTRYEMDSLNAPLFNRNNHTFSSRGIQSRAKAGRPQPQIQQVRSIGEILQRTNSICYDTSSRFFLDSDSLMYYVQDPVRTSDGNLLLCGEYINYTDYKGGGFLMKCDNDGNLIWNRLYDTANAVRYNYINFSHPVELMDGSIFLAGYTNDLGNENDNLLMLRTDANGNIIWNKVLYSRFWTGGNGSSDYFYLQDVKQDPYTGDLYFTGPHWTDGKALVKLDLNTGNVLWSNSYTFGSMGYASFDLPFGIDIRQNEIRYWGRNAGNIETFIHVLRIDKQTGDTISRKVFQCTDTSGSRAEILFPDKLSMLNNGNTILTGRTYGYWIYQWDGVFPLYHASMIEVNDNLDIVKSLVFRSPVQDNGYNTRITVFPDGTGTFNYLEVYSGYTADAYFSHLSDGQLINRRKKKYTNSGFPLENRTLQLPDGGNITAKLLGDSINNNGRIEFLKRHASDTASYCLGYEDTITFAQPVNYIPMRIWSKDTVYRNVFLERPTKTLRLTNYTGYRSPACFQVSHCDTVWLTASPTLTCPGMPVTVSIHKNNDCGTEVPLQYDTTGVASVVRNNDSTYTFIFNSSWTNYIKASLLGCTLHRDSVQLTILAAPPAVNLGPDTVICPSNTVLLHAGPGFATYLWQDGSTDSLFSVTQPGQYYVTVTNACGGTFSDTINVAPHPPIPFSIGPDRTMCDNDTIQLHATTGFLNYSWSPVYNISSVTAADVVVNPAVNTVYTVIAEKTPGCFAYDTVQVTVYQSIPVNLGADKSICTGDSVILDGGPGFASYNWNTGASTQRLTVTAAGEYRLTATTAQGCVSRDTFRLISIYALPVVNLNKDSTLCTGDSRLLDAGGGLSFYQWNTGSTASSINVTGTGVYAVEVTDQFGCKGRDTSRITRMLPLPAGFLFADTAICSYGKLELLPLAGFSTYLWNTGNTAASLQISTPGTYWLEVTDANNCKGRDSVIVALKQCMQGLYMPAAFTPNNDGKNDIAFPYLFGDISSYEFMIYNRWGEVVFRSSIPGQGWNGIYKGIPQDTGVYIWFCRYQLTSQPVMQERGTVTLIR